MSDSNKIVGLPASDLEDVFRGAGVLVENLNAAKSKRAKATLMGQFLSQNLDREVPIEVGGRTGRATLRCITGRANGKRYYFEVWWDEEPDDTDNSRRPVPTDPVSPPSSGGSGPSTNGTHIDGSIEGAIPAEVVTTNAGLGNGEDW